MKIEWIIKAGGRKPVIERHVDGVLRSRSKPFESIPAARRALEKSYKKAVARYEKRGELQSHGMDTWTAWVEVDAEWMITVSAKLSPELRKTLDEMTGILKTSNSEFLRELLEVLGARDALLMSYRFAEGVGVSVGEWIGDYLRRGVVYGKVPISVGISSNAFLTLECIANDIGVSVETVIADILEAAAHEHKCE